MQTDAEWIDLIQRVTRLESAITVLVENDIPHIREELTWIRERLNRGYRPPWSVAALVAFFASLSVGLAVALLK